MSLEEAIQKLINLGEKDPLNIARAICERNDKDWLLSELEALAEDVVADIARRRLSGQRRSAEIALRPGDEIASAELKLRSFWIPGKGWTRAAELAANDLRVRATWEERLAGSIMRRVEWMREVAGLMDSEGVKKLGQLKATLPALPDDEQGGLIEAIA